MHTHTNNIYTDTHTPHKIKSQPAGLQLSVLTPSTSFIPYLRFLDDS